MNKLNNIFDTRKKRFSIITLFLFLLGTVVARTLLVTTQVAKADSLFSFNEGYGTTVNDNSGSASGTITNADWKTEDLCKSGMCLYFDGTSYIDYGDENTYDWAVGDSFTISFWFRHGPATSAEVIVQKYEGTGGDGGYRIQMESDGDISFSADNDNSGFPTDSVTSTSANYDDNKWHYVSAVKNGTTSMQLYIDARLVAENTSLGASTGTLANDDNFYIGDSDGTDNGDEFIGFIDELKIYTTTARTQAEVNADYIGTTDNRGTAASFGPNDSFLSDGLVGYWKLDEDSGTNVADYSGNNLTGTAQDANAGNGDGDTPPPVSGSAKFGYTRNFDGTDDLVSIGDQNVLEAQEYTFSAWIYRDGTCGTFTVCSILSKGVAGNQGYSFVLDGTNSYVPEVRLNDTIQRVTGTTSITTGNWYHLTATINSEYISIFIDGELETTEKRTISSITHGGESFKIGNSNDNSDLGFEGYIDEVRVYNRALSPAEVKNLYEWAPGPVAHWKMDEGTGSPQTSTDMVAYNEDTIDTPKYRTHSANFSSEGAALDVISGTGPEFEYVRVAAKPNSTSDEKILCTKDNSDDVDCQVWDGTSWGNSVELTTNDAFSNLGFDVAYEHDSGVPIACNIDTTDQSLPYCNIWDGTDWTTTANATDNSQNITNLLLFPDPNSDHIALLTKSTGDLVTAEIWDGSSWASQQILEGTGTASDNWSKSYNGAWDSNGDFMAVWYDITDGELEARQFIRGTGWDTQIDGVNTALPTSSAFAQVQVAAHPSNGEMLVIVADDDDDVETSFWDGSSWTADTQIEDDLGTGLVDAGNILDVAYEQGGNGDAIATYGTTNNALKYRVWDTSAGSWGSEQSLPTSSDAAVDWHQLASDPLTDSIMLTLVGSVNDVESLEWTGDDWESSYTSHETASDNNYWNAWFTYDYRLGDALDTSGNDNHSRMELSMTENDWVAGKFGNGIDFDGSDDYLSIPYGGDRDVDFNGDESFTIGAWVYIKTMPGSGEQDAIISKWDQTNTLRAYRLVVENDDADSTGNFQVELYDESADQSITATGTNDTVNVNTWYHVEFTFNGGTAGDAGDLELFVNGSSVDSNSQNASFLGLEDVNTDYVIGNYDPDDAIAGNTAFTGIVDDVRVYSYERNSSQVTSDMNAGHPAPGSPVGSALLHYKFNEGYGDTANDSGTGGNNGDLAGSGTTCPTTGACPSWSNSGKFGKALDFDGAAGSGDDLVDAGSAAELDDIFSGGGTFSAWFKMDSFGEGGFGRLMDKEASDLAIYVSAGGANDATNAVGLLRNCTTDGRWHTPENSVSSGTWYHFVAVYDDSDVNNDPVFYLDGEETTVTETTTPSGTCSSDASSNLIIGNNDANSRTFDGIIDDVRIYDSELTSGQIKQLYNQGSAAVWGASSSNTSGDESYSAADAYCPPGSTDTCTGPVGEWLFNENTGTGNGAVKDTSGNDNHGDMESSMTTSDWVPGYHGSAMDFDGNDDYISIDGTVSEFQFGTGDFTFSAWVKTTQDCGPDYKNYISKYSSTVSPILQCEDSGSNGLARFSVRDSDSVSQAVTGVNDITDGAWHHLVGVKEGHSSATLKIYVDGVLENTASANYSGNMNNNDAVNIGRHGNNSRHADALMDEVRIYNYARTPAQIAWEYNRGGPVGWWKMDDNVSGDNKTITDHSGNGNNGTTVDTGGTAIDCTVAGKRNLACHFDGSNDHLDMDDPADLEMELPMSLSAWVNLDALPSTGGNNYALAGKYNNSSTNNYIWQIESNDSLIFYKHDGSSGEYAPGSIDFDSGDVGNWKHVATTIDSSGNITWYENGIQVDSGTLSSTNMNTSTNAEFFIGARDSGPSYFFDGKIDDVRVYNYDLTEEQIQTVMNEGVLRFGPNTGNP